MYNTGMDKTKCFAGHSKVIFMNHVKNKPKIGMKHSQILPSVTLVTMS